jgi:3-deoxy-manno-octulosonate cytidylyltransferase (CMP-KDO synthetase)
LRRFTTNFIKVVVNRRNYALYFSRAPIAWEYSAFPPDNNVSLSNTNAHYRHRGIYAYRVGFLLEFIELEPCPLEKVEKIEQLRTLWYGNKVHVAVAGENIPPDVNTALDLEKVQKLLKTK